MKGMLVHPGVWGAIEPDPDADGNAILLDAATLAKAYHLLMSGVKDAMLATLCTFGSASQVWQRLAAQYAHVSRARSIQLRGELLSCKITHSMGVAGYVRDIEQCRNRLALIWQDC